MKKEIPILLITIIFFSCKKVKVPFVDCNQPTSEVNLCKQLIKKRWVWSYEIYFSRLNQTNIIKTPASEGYTKEIEFTNSGIVFIYKNSSLEREATYNVSTFDKITGVIADNTITVLIFYDKQTGQRFDFAPIKICSDTLTLNYQFYSDTKGQQKWEKK